MQQIFLECFRPADLAAAWHERKVLIPDSFQEFARSTHLILAHLTSSTIVPAILDCGIQPRAGGAKAIEDGCHAELGDVYLSSGIDKFYFQRAVKAHGGVGTAVVVRLAVSMLRADTNILSLGALQGMSEVEALHLSLIAGVCGHRGPVPPEAVISVVDESGAPYQASRDQ